MKYLQRHNSTDPRDPQSLVHFIMNHHENKVAYENHETERPKECAYVTVRSPDFRLFLYLTGVYF